MGETLFPAEYVEARGRYRAFMDEHVYPNEAAIEREDDAALALLEELRGRAREAGLWAPHVPPEAGGTGLVFLYYACLNEEIGRSTYAQLVFGCQAPDAGNAEILHMFGTGEQKERFLRPLVAGELRSFFSMTEPEVAGSDPTLLRTRAVRDGDEWVIDGHKWFSSGADGAAFAVVFAISDPDAEPHRRGTMILVPADVPGVEVLRPVPVMGHTGRGWSTHCEVRYTRVRVPVANTLGEEGDAFRIAQKRLGPGRIHHCMRWVGICERAFELMCQRASVRELSPGKILGAKQTVQEWIAESRAEINAARMMVLNAAWKIDTEGVVAAREEISLIKFYVAGVLDRVDGDNLVVGDGGRGAGLAGEPAASGAAGRQLRGHHLDRHDPVQRLVERAKYNTHPAATDNLQHLVVPQSPDRPRLVGRFEEAEHLVAVRGRRCPRAVRVGYGGKLIAQPHSGRLKEAFRLRPGSQ